MMVLVLFGLPLLILTGVIFQGKLRIILVGSHMVEMNTLPIISLGL